MTGRGRSAVRRRAVARSLSSITLLALACTPPLGKLGDVDEQSDTDGPELPPPSERMAVLELDDGALDILFIIDNSGSMGIEQARASVAIGRLVAETTQQLGTSLRVGFTTTDNGNPWCQGTTPEAGQLSMSSCAGRLDEFVFEGAVTIDVRDEACLELCDLETVTTLPTTTHLDDTPAARPWLEGGPAGGNVDAAAIEQIARCVAPQGVAGCGFESPLEVMHTTLGRAGSPSDAAYGFLRPWARLAVVFVTDEVDCSVDEAWEEVFLPDGNRVFWEDPETPAPSSAVCWHAGVQCQGTEPEIGPCNPQNYDVEGEVTTAANAVMRSLTRYIEDLQAVEASKAAYRPDDAVAVAVIGGVPVGYADGTAELRYTRYVDDPEFVEDFGVDPGCDGPAGTAVPPVRLRSLAELFPAVDDEVVHSICSETFSPALDSLYETLATPRLEPVACIPGCLADVDPAAGTQVECEVVMARAGAIGREEQRLTACDAGAVPEGEDACYRLRVDDDAASCAAEGSNAELELVMRDGMTVQGLLSIETVCELAPAGTC